MLCCSDCCPKYKDCALACINAEYKNRLDQVESLYTYGSCSIQYVNGEVKMNENYMCGPTSNYAMFIPKISPEYDKVFRKFKELQGHQITMDEWMEEKEKQDLTMNDLYYMQFSNIVLETMKTAKEALTEQEYKLFIQSIQKLCKQGVRKNE